VPLHLSSVTLVCVGSETGTTSTSELGLSSSLISMKKWSPRCLMSYSTLFTRGRMTFHSPSGSSADRKRVSDVTEEPAIKQQEVDLKLRDSEKLRDREHEVSWLHTVSRSQASRALPYMLQRQRKCRAELQSCVSAVAPNTQRFLLVRPATESTSLTNRPCAARLPGKQCTLQLYIL